MEVTDQQIQSLLEQLSDGKYIDFWVAGPKLKFIGERALPFLLAACHNSRPRVREGVIETLTAFANSNETAAAAIVEALDDPDDGVRITAVRAIAPTGLPHAFEVVLDLLKNGTTRVGAYLLCYYNDPRATNELLKMLSSEDPYTVLITINALLSSRHPILESEGNQVYSIIFQQVARRENQRDARLMSGQSSGADNPVRERLPECEYEPADDDKELDEEIFRFASEVLKSAGESAIPDFVSALAHPVSLVRRLALGAMAAIPDPKFAGAVTPLLNDSDPLVQWCAAWFLGILKSTNAVPRLISMIDDPEYPSTKYNVINALASIGDTRAVNPICAALIRLAVDDGSYMWRNAAECLTRFGRAGIMALMDLMKSTDSATRLAAAYGLNFARDPSSISAMIAATHDPDLRVRREALWASVWINPTIVSASPLH